MEKTADSAFGALNDPQPINTPLTIPASSLALQAAIHRGQTSLDGSREDREKSRQFSHVSLDGWMLHGTSDLIYRDQDGVETVIELKSLHAVRSACEVWFEKSPEVKHLIQTAIYMWLGQMPGILFYTNRNRLQLMFYAKQYSAQHLMPYVQLFRLKIDEGRVFWQIDGMQQWNWTVITIEGIERYFRHVWTMAETGDLGPRPSNPTAYGKANKWTACTYCALKDTCDFNEDSGYEAWVDAATKALSQKLS